MAKLPVRAMLKFPFTQHLTLYMYVKAKYTSKKLSEILNDLKVKFASKIVHLTCKCTKSI